MSDASPETSPDSPPAPRKKRIGKDIARICTVALFFIGAAVLLNNSAVRSQLFDIETLRREMDGAGARGIALFILASALVNALGVPRLWVSAVAGSLFGAVQGTAVGFVATLLGAAANFMMGRSLLRGPIKRHMPARLQRWYKALNRHGFRTILYLRLFPGANATLTSLVGGASKMRFRDYIIATAIGFVPFTIVFATLGSSAAKQSKWQLLGGLLLFVLVAAAQWIFSRARKKGTEIVEDSPSDAMRNEAEPHLGRKAET